MRDNSVDAFFALVRAGLWGKAGVTISDVLNLNENVDWEKVYQLAQEQSVQGIVLQGIEWLKKHNDKLNFPQVLLLQWIGEVRLIEQRNKEMNAFVAELFEKLYNQGINALLVKGQGLAQCYEKPLWRTSGDVDLFLSDKDYSKAKVFLLPLSHGNKPERRYSKELGVSIFKWYVELHGTQRTGLSSRLDKEIDDLQICAFNNREYRSWLNENSKVFLPSADEDVLFVFTHFLKHFYKEERVCLRQICDWCRLLWSFHNKLDFHILELRLRKMHLMAEWEAFGAIAVKYLGLPKDIMPFYNEFNSRQWVCDRILSMILHNGNRERLKAACSAIRIFPINTIRFLPGILFDINWLKIEERYFRK